MVVKSILLLVIALSCVVSGNVIINVFDEDNDGTDVLSDQQSSEQSCNLSWCEQTCRRMGFPGGACVGDRCKCDILHDDTYAIVKPELQKCKDWCNPFCQSMRYAGGFCYEGTCYCKRKQPVHKSEIMKNEIEEPLQECKDWCNSRCQSMGYAGGFCYGGTCYCKRKQPGHKLEIMKNENEESALQECKVWCNSECLAMGYPGGVCYDGKCYCRTNKPMNQVEIKKTEDEKSALQECKDWCYSKCQALGYSGGICHGEICYCGATDETAHKSETSKNYVKSSLQACPDWCDSVCRAMGHSGGSCNGETCYCSVIEDIRDAQSSVQDCKDCNSTCKNLDFLEGVCLLGEDCYCRVGKPKECSLFCSNICIGFEFQGGICNGGDCFCGPAGKVYYDIIVDKSKEGLVALPSTSDSTCDIVHCSAVCQQEGFPFALCSKDKCYCVNNQDGALEVSAPGQVCAPSSCHQVCREMNYFRGTCSGNTSTCKCHKQQGDRSKEQKENPDEDVTTEFNKSETST